MLVLLVALQAPSLPPACAQYPVDGRQGGGVYGPEPEPGSYTPPSQPMHHRPAPPDPRTRSAAAWTTLDHAKQLIMSRQTKEALPLINGFIATKPMEPEGYFWQGLVLDDLGDIHGAIEALEKALVLTTRSGMDSAELRVNVGNIFLKHQQYDRAINQYERALAIEKKMPIANLNLARTLIAKGDAEAALPHLQRCSELHFDVSQTTYYKVKALVMLGRKDEARLQLQRLLERLNNNDERSRIQTEFKEALN